MTRLSRLADSLIGWTAALLVGAGLFIGEMRRWIRDERGRAK